MAEIIMLIRNRDLVFIYGFIALCFAVGFLLRLCHLYPGDEEPLILDLSGTLIALCYAGFAYLLLSSLWRFLLRRLHWLGDHDTILVRHAVSTDGNLFSRLKVVEQTANRSEHHDHESAQQQTTSV